MASTQQVLGGKIYSINYRRQWFLGSCWGSIKMERQLIWAEVWKQKSLLGLPALSN